MFSFMSGMFRLKLNIVKSFTASKIHNCQVANLRSIDAPVLLDVIQKALPEGSL